MESINTPDLQHLSKSSVLDHKDDSGLAVQFLQSAAYAGAEAPLRGLAQVADHITGAHTDAAVQSGFKVIGVEQPRPAEFGTSQWMVQQAGGAVGMMLPFMALRSGVNHAAGGLIGGGTLAGPLEAGAQNLTQAAVREAALSGATGLLYGSLLSPSSEANVGTSSFYADRLKTGLANGASFAVLSAINPYVTRGLESGAAAVESSSMLPALAKTPLTAALKFPAVTGMISGIPSGIVNAETNALKDGRLLPSSLELKESIGSMAFVGGAMGTATWLLERAAASNHDRSTSESEQRAAAESRERAASESRERDAKGASDRTAPATDKRSREVDLSILDKDSPEDIVGQNISQSHRMRFLAKDASDDNLKVSVGGASQWKQSEFESPVDGTSIGYKMREGDRSQPARVFSGGLALNDGFEPFFASGPPEGGSEYFMWTRSNYPSEWKITPKILDADARDLANMVSKAAETSDSGNVELVLHSFGTTVAQRMVQMHDDPQVASALKHVSHIWMIDPTTHFEGMEKVVGPEMEQMGTGSKNFVGALDLMDATAGAQKAMTDLNFTLPKEAIKFFYGEQTAENMAALNQMNSGSAVWSVQRDALMGLASKLAVEAQHKDLQEPWQPANEPFRQQCLDRLAKNAVDPGWQEATLRRLGDLFKLEMKEEDMDYLHNLGIPVDMIHSTHDQVLTWNNSRMLLNLMKIPSPDQMPAAGTLLTNADGTFRSHFVDADHYWPQKHPEQLREVLNK